MKRQKLILWIAVVLLVACPLALLLRKPAPLDLSRDEEPFKSMALPPKSVRGDIIMDGGSVITYVIDRNGIQNVIKFPIERAATVSRYPTANYQNMANQKLIPLKDPARAKEIMFRLLKDYGDKGDQGVSRALFSLSPSMGYKAHLLIDKAKEMMR